MGHTASPRPCLRVPATFDHVCRPLTGVLLCAARPADDQLQLTQKVGRRSLGYDEFMSACEAMVALHGALASQQTKRIPSEREKGGGGRGWHGGSARRSGE